MAARVIAIFGPTASGKTALAEAIAERIPAELISADSMQVYRGLPILTNQPEAPTRLVGIWDLDREASVADYERLAHEAVDEALAAGRTPVVVGGTGLYFRAALASLELPPPPEPGARERWQAEYDRLGGEAAHALLAERDPAAAAVVHPNDRRRIVRALELAEAGRSLRPAEETLWAAETRRPTLLFGLTMEREQLYRRIDERVDAMVAAGAADEARRAAAAGASPTARKALGFEELLAGDVESMKRRTRNYARRQLTWMRKLAGVTVIDTGAMSPARVAGAIFERWLAGEGAGREGPRLPRR